MIFLILENNFFTFIAPNRFFVYFIYSEMYRPLRRFHELTKFQKDLILLKDETKLPRPITSNINRICWVCGSTAKLRFDFFSNKIILIYYLANTENITCITRNLKLIFWIMKISGCNFS